MTYKPTCVTALTHSHSALAKHWMADGTIRGYDETKNYQVDQRHVHDIHELSALLLKLENAKHTGIIRGQYKGEAYAAATDPEHVKGRARKIKVLFEDAPVHWLLVEVDKYEPKAAAPIDQIREYITTCLPEPFHDITFHWQLSSSAGHPKSAGKLKVHIYFWLTTPVNSLDIKAWAQAQKIPLDTSVLNPVQFHYTASPTAAPGVAIPVDQRSGLEFGFMGDEVNITVPPAPRVGAGGGTGLVPYGGVAAVVNEDGTVDDDGDGLMEIGQTLEWSIEHAREVLMDINADSDRQTWFNDIAALHHETRGSPEGLELAVEWSSQAANFDSREDVEKRWESCGRYVGKPMTGAWLLKRQQECNATLKYKAKDECVKLINDAKDEFQLREKVCPQLVADDRLDDLAREALAQVLVAAFKRLGTKYPVAAVRKLIAPKKVDPKMGEGGAHLDNWSKGWVYVTDKDQFFRIDSAEWLSMQGFNAKFNRLVPAMDDNPKSAAWVALEDIQIPSVTKGVYLPWAPADVFTMHGVECVNTYRPSSTPEAVEYMSPEGERARDVVIEHLRLLSGGRADVMATLLDWLAHNVQKPGVKIRWAPLIKGVEGDGKTMLSTLLAAVMGRVNVRNVSPKVLETAFTGWAEGSAVVVLEEIKITGHNRYDVLNALKPFLTNDSIEVHPKGQDTHDAINTTNYVAFTNYSDALPLTDTDRRWWILFTVWTNIVELAAATGGDLGAYFDRFHEAVASHPAELRRWLLDHPISKSFKPNGKAPDTKEKLTMISLSRSDAEDTLRDILENVAGKRGVTATLFSSRCMGYALEAENDELELDTSKRNRLFSNAGFTKQPKKVKWAGEAHSIWTKGTELMEPEAIRAILDATVTETSSEDDVHDLF